MLLEANGVNERFLEEKMQTSLSETFPTRNTRRTLWKKSTE
jgi:hypothetical protein